jgi:hypothetical protein
VLGNAQRNYTGLRGPGSYDEDLKASKLFNLGEHVSFILEMNYFNLLNRVRFNGPNTNIDDAANFGLVNAGQQNNARQGQLSGRLQF